MTTTVTPTTFKARFPEFTSVDDSRIQVFIDDAVVILNESYWGTKYDLGIYYYTAHELSKSLGLESSGGSGGGSGAVSSRSVDGASVSYATNAPDNLRDAYYSSTSYGLKYLSLMRTLPIPASSI